MRKSPYYTSSIPFILKYHFNMFHSRLYKILTNKELKDFARDKIFRGNDIDRYCGYIHLSANPQQYNHVIKKYYNTHQEVNVLELDDSKMLNVTYYKGCPHYYGKLYWYHILNSVKITNPLYLKDGIILSFE